MAIARHSSRPLALALLALTLGATACKDNVSPEPEPEIETMRITPAGSAPVTVSSSGVVTGTFSIAAGVAKSFTVEFLNAAGDPDPLVTDAEFEASVTPAAGITFARTSAFAGTLTGANAGTVSVQFGLFHLAEQHNDFGPFAVNVTITP
jgi:hypothetical protein